MGLFLAAATEGLTPLIDQQVLKTLKSKYGPKAYDRGMSLSALLERLKDADALTKLTEVNRFFNGFTYRSDQELWGVHDYWATPTEFIGRHGGDCEDYVVSKYFALRALGIADEHLYLTYVKATKQNIAHMVLNYFETKRSVPLVLDNYNPALLPASQRGDLIYVYSFNAASLFLSNASAGLGRSLPTDKIRNSKWDKLLSNLSRGKK